MIWLAIGVAIGIFFSSLYWITKSAVQVGSTARPVPQVAQIVPKVVLPAPTPKAEPAPVAQNVLKPPVLPSKPTDMEMPPTRLPSVAPKLEPLPIDPNGQSRASVEAEMRRFGLQDTYSTNCRTDLADRKRIAILYAPPSGSYRVWRHPRIIIYEQKPINTTILEQSFDVLKVSRMGDGSSSAALPGDKMALVLRTSEGVDIEELIQKTSLNGFTFISTKEAEKSLEAFSLFKDAIVHGSGNDIFILFYSCGVEELPSAFIN